MASIGSSSGSQNKRKLSTTTPRTEDDASKACRTHATSEQNADTTWSTDDDSEDEAATTTALGKGLAQVSDRIWQKLDLHFRAGCDKNLSGLYAGGYGGEPGVHNDLSWSVASGELCDLFDADGPRSWRRVRIKLPTLNLGPDAKKLDEAASKEFGLRKPHHSSTFGEHACDCTHYVFPVAVAEGTFETLAGASFVNGEHASLLVGAIMQQNGAPTKVDRYFYGESEPAPQPADACLLCLYEAEVVWPAQEAGQIVRWLHVEGLYSLPLLTGADGQHYNKRHYPALAADGSERNCWGSSKDWDCCEESCKLARVLIRCASLIHACSL